MSAARWNGHAHHSATGAAHPVPPAEYHNPVPLQFLTVKGAYAVYLYGSDEKDLGLAAQWLTEAGDELGAGAKTAAGYGYRVTFRPVGPLAAVSGSPTQLALFIREPA